MDLSEIVPKVYIEPIVVPKRLKKNQSDDVSEEQPATEDMLDGLRLSKDAAKFNNIINA